VPYKSQPNAKTLRNVVRRHLLSRCIDGIILADAACIRTMWSGRAFQVAGPARENARSQTSYLFVRKMLQAAKTILENKQLGEMKIHTASTRIIYTSAKQIPNHASTREDNLAQTHRNSSQSSTIHILQFKKNATFCVFQMTRQKVAAGSYTSLHLAPDR